MFKDKSLLYIWAIGFNAYEDGTPFNYYPDGLTDRQHLEWCRGYLYAQGRALGVDGLTKIQNEWTCDD